MPARNVINPVDLERVKEWLGHGGKKVLVYHRDADGVCSAALLMKFFRDFEGIPREGPVIDDAFYRELVSKRPDLLVFMDIPADQEWKKLLKMSRQIPELRLMIIDHHVIEKDLNSGNAIHINPRFLKRDYYIPASCVIYELLRKIGYDVKPYLWISLTGIIGDYGMKDCKWMFREQAKSGKATHSQLFRASEIVSSAITLKGIKGAKKALDLLIKSEDFKDFRGSEDLKRWNTIVQKEVKRIVRDFERNKEVFGKERLIFYEIKSKMNITSIIATITAEKHPDDIVIIRKKAKDFWKISLRYQAGKVSVGDLAKSATKGIGSGGGHIKSAGAIANSWEKFRKRVFRYLK